jgi:hypothetical protein
VFILNYKGKYFLDQVENNEYFTNDYSLYCWYNKLFYDFDVHIDTYQHNPKDELAPVIAANKDALRKALREEIAHYENGYIYKSEWFLIRGKKVKKGRWVNEPEKAKLLFNDIKKRHKELFLNECCFRS